MKLNVGVACYWKLEAFNPVSGKTRQLTDWFKNLLLTTGRNNLASQNWFNFCQVGTSDAVPDAGQAELQGWFAGTSTLFGTETSGAEAVAPYYGWKRKTFEFPELAGANQILKEVGIGWLDGSVPSTPGLTTRGLIVDINGNTATPVWKTGEILRVTAEVRYYPPLDDVTGSVTFNSVAYSYILRAANVTVGAEWGSRIGQPMGAVNGESSAWNAYPDNISADITGEPTGVAVQCDNTSQYNIAYANGTYQIAMGCNCGAAGWNVPGGLRSLRFRTTAGSYQIQFGDGVDATGNAVPKTTDFTMFFSPILSWSQGTIA